LKGFNRFPPYEIVFKLLHECKQTMDSLKKPPIVFVVYFPEFPSGLSAEHQTLAYPIGEPIARTIELLQEVASNHVPLRKNSKLLRQANGVDASNRQPNSEGRDGFLNIEYMPRGIRGQRSPPAIGYDKEACDTNQPHRSSQETLHGRESLDHSDSNQSPGSRQVTPYRHDRGRSRTSDVDRHRESVYRSSTSDVDRQSSPPLGKHSDSTHVSKPLQDTHTPQVCKTCFGPLTKAVCSDCNHCFCKSCSCMCVDAPVTPKVHGAVSGEECIHGEASKAESEVDFENKTLELLRSRNESKLAKVAKMKRPAATESVSKRPAGADVAVMKRPGAANKAISGGAMQLPSFACEWSRKQVQCRPGASGVKARAFGFDECGGVGGAVKEAELWVMQVKKKMRLF
jgi:hypothetical protein